MSGEHHQRQSKRDRTNTQMFKLSSQFLCVCVYACMRAYGYLPRCVLHNANSKAWV